MSETEKKVLTATEPWLRGTLGEVPAVARAVLHALELAAEDLRKWYGPLSEHELQARPAGLPPVAFQLRHIAGSVDRLLTYAEDAELSAEQLNALRSEMDFSGSHAALFAELTAALERGAERIRALAGRDLNEPRSVGKRQLPATLGGLLVHVADHTQRHVGQAITTAKVVLASRRD